MTAPAPALITDVCVEPSTPDEVQRGIAAWVRCTVAGLFVIDGIPLRCTSHGQLVLTFPQCADAVPRRHPFVRPVDTAPSAVLAQAIGDALRSLDQPEDAGDGNPPPS